MSDYGMNSDLFNSLLDELDGNSLETLKRKNAMYSSDNDTLHNFRDGAEILGGTPAQACWGYLTKHLVALRDMVIKNDFSNREDLLEKCQDSINYIRFLWCIANDTWPTSKVTVEKKFKNDNDTVDTIKDCIGKETGYRVIFDSKEEALNVKNQLESLIKNYGKVTIQDLNDLCNIHNYNYINNRYGWKSIEGAEILLDNDRFILKLPSVIPFVLNH